MSDEKMNLQKKFDEWAKKHPDIIAAFMPIGLVLTILGIILIIIDQ